MSDATETTETTQAQPKKPPAPRKAPKAPAASKGAALTPAQADANGKSDKMAVELAVLHSAVMFQGFTLEHWNESKAPGVQMLWIRGEGLLVRLKGKEMLIPVPTVKNVIFASRHNGRIVES